MSDNASASTRRPGSIPPASAEDLRSATRFRQEPKTAFALIHDDVGPNLRVEVYDESLFGICLVMADTRGLSVGDEIELTYAASDMQGTVKHVTPFKDELYLVGLATRPLIDGRATSSR